MATLSWNEVQQMMKAGRTQDILAAQGGAQTQNESQSQSAELPGYVATVPRSSGPDTAGGDAAYQSGKTRGTGPNAQAVTAANKAALNVDLASGFSKEIKNASENMQNQANSYVADIGGYTESQGPSEADITGAIGGDQTAYDKLMGRLGATFGGKEYAPDEKAIRDVGLLANPEGRQSVAEEYFGNKTGGRYTAGMSALDQTLFNAQRPDLSPVFKERQDLDLLKASLKDTAAKARAAEETEFGTATEGIKTGLKAKADAIRKSAEGRLSEANLQDETALGELAKTEAERQYNESGVGKIREDLMGLKVGDKTYDAEVDALTSELDALGEQIAKGQFVQRNAGTRDVSAYTSPEEAAQFSRIMSLLGLGDNLATGGTATAGSVGTKDDLGRAITDLQTRIGDLGGRKPVITSDMMDQGQGRGASNPTEQNAQGFIDEIIDANDPSAIDPVTEELLKKVGVELPTPESQTVTTTGGVADTTPAAGRTFETNPVVKATDTVMDTVKQTLTPDNFINAASGGVIPAIQAGNETLRGETPSVGQTIASGGAAPIVSQVSNDVQAAAQGGDTSTVGNIASGGVLPAVAAVANATGKGGGSGSGGGSTNFGGNKGSTGATNFDTTSSIRF